MLALAMLALAAFGLALVLAPSTAGRNRGKAPVARQAKNKVIQPGFDLFETTPGSTSVSFMGPTLIPAGFFGTAPASSAGSQPFTGKVPLMGVPIGYFQGHPIGGTDSIVHRLGALTLPSPTGTATIPIQLVKLSLQSSAPLMIHFSDGTTEPWNVKVDLSPSATDQGTITIHGLNLHGGTVDATLPVIPRFTFTRAGTSETKVLDYGLQTRAQLIQNALEKWHTTYTYDASGRLIAIHGLNKGFCEGCTGRGRSHDFSQQSPLFTQHVHMPQRLWGVPRGFDVFETPPGGTRLNIPSTNPIPGVLFDLGCTSVSGTIGFQGQPIGLFHGVDLGTGDTVVERKTDAGFRFGKLRRNKPRGTATISIELVALSLQSTSPLQVSCPGHVEQWNVKAEPSPSAHSSGKMKMKKVNDSGGTFSSKFSVYPELIFTRLSDGATRKLDVGSSLLAERVSGRRAGLAHPGPALLPEPGARR
jgi:YD repeat-containing protein